MSDRAPGPGDDGDDGDAQDVRAEGPAEDRDRSRRADAPEGDAEDRDAPAGSVGTAGSAREPAGHDAPEPSPPSARRPADGGDEAPSGSGAGGAIRAMSLALLVLIGGCLGGGLLSWVVQLFDEEPEPAAEVIEVQPTPDVVVAVRDLARLESASFHVERVIDLSSRQRHVFGLVEAEDSILLVAAADVVAGVDLSEMEDGDVVIEPERRRATLTLPPVRILSARLDNDRTYVHRRETDVLADRRDDLETRARREAERTLRESAIEGGILRRAERNAAHTVETLVRSLGYEDVVVRFGDDEG
ncbi:MAG TPA: DUF4230 domain-containing protein [Sandaracinaceae bacterium LLY-WYZ-13_1]|nr:DUF4230 domain-containing protein [Sandaracinaceae bacterium LLY-WYZ-13_1]